jgi:hypothetical protein
MITIPVFGNIYLQTTSQTIEFQYHKYWHNLGKQATQHPNLKENNMKKTPSTSFILAALILLSSSLTSTRLAAQEAGIQFDKITVSTGAHWIGYNEMSYTKVLLLWNVNADADIARLEVECSFDLVNFSSIGKATEAVSTDRKSKTFQFEDKSWILSKQPVAQYRIKMVDNYGTVHYSEAKLVGLKS